MHGKYNSSTKYGTITLLFREHIYTDSACYLSFVIEILTFPAHYTLIMVINFTTDNLAD